MSPDMWGAFAQFGPMGLMVGYLIWRDTRREKLDRDRIETDKLVASALAIVATKIDGMKH